MFGFDRTANRKRRAAVLAAATSAHARPQTSDQDEKQQEAPLRPDGCLQMPVIPPPLAWQLPKGTGRRTCALVRPSPHTHLFDQGPSVTLQSLPRTPVHGPQAADSGARGWPLFFLRLWED